MASGSVFNARKPMERLLHSRGIHKLLLTKKSTFLSSSRRDFASSSFVKSYNSSTTRTYGHCRHFSTLLDTQPTKSSATASKDSVSIDNTHGSDNDNKGTSPTKRRKLSEVPISDVLKAKHTLRWVEPVICQSATVKEAVEVCIEGSLSGMMVIDRAANIDSSRERGKVAGLLTSRDLLRIMSAGFKEGQSPDKIMNKTVLDFMTPINQVIYARPEETIGMCRTLMAKLGVKCLPVLSNGRVEGLITARDMSDFGLEAKDRGGKKTFLKHVSARVGLSSNTSMAEPPEYLQAHLALQQTPVFANVGVAEIPNPFKSHRNVGINRRDFGPDEVADDPDLSEDAYFVANVELPDENGKGKRNVLYAGVADGVGSWREFGVDPKEFSHRLMEECENILQEASSEVGGLKKGDEKFRRMITPAEVMKQAYERVKSDNIIGSSTACIALFDGCRHQLHFSNLGDCGIIVLRHIDSSVAGALKHNRVTRREERQSDLRVAFVSQQQLRSFNHPYQLGWTGEDIDSEESTSFKNAADSCTTSIHIRRGDIILMATDGLFDNVDIDDIAKISLKWEQDNGFIKGGDIIERQKRWSKGESMTLQSVEQISDLTKRLCDLARENSLDSSIDSPFAILAKENDIMWSGGMPDDCTIIGFHVVGKSSKEDMFEVSELSDDNDS
eukprot:CAMPEP_0197823492 /NCGR_PEP_ID=MMETSP1437-20131217/841_1 /TAXON_ID=49252 ORGANISM="Eucampia antarctica, Strain CCMP1452" /NCGR_SAMPLE_ID=MMETSP1437 /ASSEMBLY_ACC=CAM_ASM_001096 /LENGTH=670 /DNA_ID=CAMNT_0043422699 /DNA_START=51 /DNA_END=2063 /DNA_ORIENTATION=-